MRHLAFKPVALSLLACTGILGSDASDTAGGACGTVWYHDQDGDGYGVPGKKLVDCGRPDDYADNADDCDDQDPGTHPGAVEACDDDANGCGLSGTLSPSTAPGEIVGSAGDGLGWGLAVGDENGDGKDAGAVWFFEGGGI